MAILARTALEDILPVVALSLAKTYTWRPHSKNTPMMIRYKDSPLICVSYHLESINLVANPAFDNNKGGSLKADNLKIVATHKLIRPEEGLWQVMLKVQQSPDLERNPPYLFTIEIVGFFKVGDFPADKKATLVGINGSSVLFSSAREILLGLTSHGPNKPITLPTIAFQCIPDPPPAGVAAGAPALPKKA